MDGRHIAGWEPFFLTWLESRREYERTVNAPNPDAVCATIKMLYETHVNKALAHRKKVASQPSIWNAGGAGPLLGGLCALCEFLLPTCGLSGWQWLNRIVSWMKKHEEEKGLFSNDFFF